ncbi:hypothetical protein BJ166DRAFT_521698 [Pestalotiopsis sp. NC0098]|nr:hypothetical protein BJ166DRAFT_521698 [Pestalotiopsis sp. NC0098]
MSRRRLFNICVKFALAFCCFVWYGSRIFWLELDGTTWINGRTTGTWRHGRVMHCTYGVLMYIWRWSLYCSVR